jgi:sugar phosphate isomerase/epimerase
VDRHWRIAAAYFTLAGDVVPFASAAPSPFDLRERADAAARAGYVGLGLEASDLAHCIDRHGHAGIRRILRDSGLTYFEVEVLFDWFADGDLRVASDRNRKLFLETASEIETAQIKVIGGPIASPHSTARMVDEFAILCQAAAAVGTAVNLEIYPDSNIRDLAAARAVVGGADQPNGGLLIDLWHMGRGGIPYEDLLTLPKGMIRAIELDDASAVQIGSIFEDTIHRRLLPGEGELDPQRFMRYVWEAGFDGVIGVEIVSAAQRARSLEDAARLSFEATRAQLDAAADSVGIAVASAS